MTINYSDSNIVRINDKAKEQLAILRKLYKKTNSELLSLLINNFYEETLAQPNFTEQIILKRVHIKLGE